MRALFAIVVLALCFISSPVAAARVVIVDPAHGGSDAGVTVGNTVEKEVTLRVARYLREELQRRGVGVRMIREDDREVAAVRRQGVATSVLVEALVSIHVNAGFGASAKGFAVYLPEFLPRPKTEKANEDGVIVSDMLLTQVINDSVRIGAELEKSLAGMFPGKSRGIHHIPLPLMAGSLVPTVVVEIGFATNPEEAKTLVTEAQQQKIALALAQGIAAALP